MLKTPKIVNVMREMQGRCNPQLVSNMIREYLKFGNSR